ncbi:hypothetical protein FQN57_006187 [Myotisia sp. PD_48]|nr:hypothetical protein FQN57_006187 [Myotisia sp. PD_48]
MDRLRNMLLYVLILSGIICNVLAIRVNTTGLLQRLSSGASIDNNNSNAPRWSLYGAPNPGAVVNVATEQDVLETSLDQVRFCKQKDIPYLAQNGGHGWATTFHLGEEGLIINLRLLNAVSFNNDKTQVKIGGGAIMSDLVEAAYANGVLIPTGTCNCVGGLGAIMGGGFGFLLGRYSLGVDNIISLRTVTAAGRHITVSQHENRELFWAMRGAGPNFGIVTSAKYKSYPQNNDQSFNAWLGTLAFTEDKLSQLVRALEDTDMTDEMALTVGMVNINSTVTLLANVFYHGTEENGKKAFSSFYAAGPASDNTQVKRYNKWNEATDAVCGKNTRKPSWGFGLGTLDIKAIQSTLDQFKQFTSKVNAGVSVTFYKMAMKKARTFPDGSSAFPFRAIDYHVLISSNYADPRLDSQVVEFGQNIRSLLRRSSGLRKDISYVNNGNGDESLETVFGGNVARLQAIKRSVDPDNRFDQFFPLL